MLRRILAITFAAAACSSERASTDGGVPPGDAAASVDAGVREDAAPPDAAAADASVFPDAAAGGPELHVLQGATELTSGGRYTFGDVERGTTSAPVVFTVENRGAAVFTFSGATAVVLEGAGAGDFTLAPPAAATIAAGGSATFEVGFAPRATGAFSASVVLRAEDGATAFSFTVEGTGTEPSAGPRLFVAVGYSGRRASSTDGATWMADSQLEPGCCLDNDTQFRGSGYGAGTWVGVGGSMVGHIEWTRDGVNWTDVSDNLGWLGGVAYGNGWFVAAGSNGRRIRSADGMTWTDPGTVPGVPVAAFRAVGFGGGVFVGVGDMGRRARTTDGLDWGNDTRGGANLRSVAYGNGTFVAVGDMGRRVISSDGITWTNDQSGGTSLQSVTFGNGVFVAVGGTRSLISASGVMWDEHTQNGLSLRSVAYGDGIFVASGFGGVRYTSPDGISWTSVAPQDGTTFVSITWGNSWIRTQPGG